MEINLIWSCIFSLTLFLLWTNASFTNKCVPFSWWLLFVGSPFGLLIYITILHFFLWLIFTLELIHPMTFLIKKYSYDLACPIILDQFMGLVVMEIIHSYLACPILLRWIPNPKLALSYVVVVCTCVNREKED